MEIDSSPIPSEVPMPSCNLIASGTTPSKQEEKYYHRLGTMKEHLPSAQTKSTPLDEGTKCGISKKKTLQEFLNQPYSFRKDKVKRLFWDALKHGLSLPICNRPMARLNTLRGTMK